MDTVPRSELDARMRRLKARLDTHAPEWQLAVVMTKVNLFYLTGTMQSGALIIPRDGDPVLWVRRSFSRAEEESTFRDIRSMRSFRDLADSLPSHRQAVHVEMEHIPLAHFARLNKYVQAEQTEPLDPHLAATRAVKSAYELALMERSGEIHRHALEDLVPAMLREGVSEAELGTELLATMMNAGHQGIARTGLFDTELLLGCISFGENALVPNPFDGPDGVRGLSPAVPLFGSRERRLKRGDLILVDVGCGFRGYHTDKSVVYCFGAEPTDEVVATHERCVKIQNDTAELLRPGAIPAEIFEHITGELSTEFLSHFMGYGDQQVNFLGHGIGLHIAEYPVIARKFDEPLEENVTLAIEPKKGLANLGMVGIENTFVVTPDGGRSITGTNPGLIRVV